MKNIIVENEIEIEILGISPLTKDNPCKNCKIRWLCFNYDEDDFGDSIHIENFPIKNETETDCIGIITEIKIIRGEELYNSLKKVYTISDSYDEIYPDDFMKKFCLKNMCPYKEENLSCFDEIDSCPFKLIFTKENENNN